MEKNKFQITMPELQQIIKEEYAAMAKENARAEEIKSRLNAINEELETLPENLEEVETGGKSKVRSTAWTGEKDGDVKWDEKFEKIGTHLKEDEEIEGEMEMGGEEEMMDSGDDMGYFETKFAELGRELDDKISGSDSEESEEIEVSMDAEGTMEEGSNVVAEEEVNESDAVAEEVVEETAEVVAEEVVEETTEVVNEEVVEETAEVVAEEVVEETTEVVNEEEVNEAEVVNEDLNEPIEGDSPAQDSEARFNDYMEKDKHVNEGVENGTTLLSEGFTPERKSALDNELDRMKRLARIK